MTIYLRQSTAGQEIPLGYFLDSTDGDTEETALTIANTDIKIWKFGATALANKSSGGATHISNGIYYAVLDDTDTDTLGSLVVFVHVAGALAVKVECVVLAANVYDSMIAGSDLLDVNTSQLGGTGQTGRDIGASVLLSPGTGTGQVSLSSGQVTVGTNNDKTGYSLTQAFPANFADLSITATTGRVDVGFIQGNTATTELAGQAATGASAALNAYDPPTKTEMQKYFSLVVRSDDAVFTDLLSELGELNANYGSGGGDYSNLFDSQEAVRDQLTTVGTDVDSILEDTSELQTDWADGGRLDLLLDTAGSGGDATAANQNTIIGHLTGIKGGTFNGATDSLEAIRDRGDAEWRTATGFSTHGAADVWGVATRTLTAFGFTVDINSNADILAILADTNELQTDWADGGRLDLLLDAAASAGEISVPKYQPVGSGIIIYRGAVYEADSGRAFTFTNAAWASLTISSVTFKFWNAFSESDSPVFTKAGSAPTSTSVRLELTSSETNSLTAGAYSFRAEAVLADGDVAVLLAGGAYVRNS